MSCLPYISLQPNYPDVFGDIASSTVSTEKVWLSAYSANAPSGSIHAKLDLHATPVSDAAEEDAETQGGVRIDSVTGGERDDLRVQRVKGSQLDLLVSSGTAGQQHPDRHDHQRSARVLQPAIALPPTHLRLPKRSIGKVLPASRTGQINQNFTAYPNIEAFDVSATQNGLFVAGGEEGALVVGNLIDSSEMLSVMDSLEDEDKEALQGRHGEEKRIEALASLKIKEREERSRREKKVYLKGHVGDVRSARFFPSGEVVLTTSSDLSTRIFSALDGSNPRTLTGHKRAVLCSGILGRGREILTGGGDGTVRLYDVGEGKQKTMFGVERFSSVNAMVVPLLDAPSAGGQVEAGEAAAAAVPNEFAVGLSSGHAEVMDIRAKKRAGIVGGYAFPPGPPPKASDSWTQEASTGQVLAIDWYRAGGRNLIATGTVKGYVSIYDARMLGSSAETPARVPPKALLASWKRNGSAVNSIKIVEAGSAGGGSVDVLVATADGLPYRARVHLGADRPTASTEDPPEMEIDADPLQQQQQQEEDKTPMWYGHRATVVEEFCGWDCDPTGVITLDHKGRVVIAGSDARIKRY
ncbi:uncharacterized protein PFL1_03063 [Pseudozyma flocculosa PF-1]|uniref:Related to RPN14 \|nr:uncharacterized protein PFL1_03063 [Pseudozyma flocculosa PF-1]EPQ29308.1 hypothetical protein PFL1_03063 [Pseudozyma flocculosa PF-1]SPO37822.1 related to RPN14 \